MRFCPKCRTRLTILEKSLLGCDECGYTEPANPVPARARIPMIERKQKLEYRPWQPDLIKRITKSINYGRRVTLDAPTGSGKTLIALKVVQALLKSSFDQAFIAVRTINEMIAFERDMRRFVPELEYRYLLGKKRACPYYTLGDDTNSALCTACLKGTENAQPRMVVDSSAIMRDKRKGLYFLEEKYVKSVSKRDGNILRNGVCLYHSMKEVQGALHLVTYPYITNRKISEAQILGEGSIRDALASSVLVVDEAHNLEGASDLFTDRLSPKMIENASQGLLDFRQCFRSEDTFLQFNDRLKSLGSHISKFCNEDGTTEHKDKHDLKKLIDNELGGVIAEIQDISTSIEKVKRDIALSGSTRKVPNPLFPIVDFISNFEDMFEKIELFAEKRGISIKVLDPSDSLEILGESKGLLLMSGTMPQKQRVEQVWGLENVEEIKLLQDYPDYYYSVFPRDNRRIELVASVSTKFQSRSDPTWSLYASIIEQVHVANRNKITLVCCPSYFVAQSIHRSLSEDCKDNCYLESTQTRLEEILRELSHTSTDRQKSLVIGVARGKILEGVEFVKDGSSLVGAVVVAGIPYPMLDDVQRWKSKIILNRLDMIDNRNAEFELFMRQPALIAVKQAIGRSIRFPKDSTTIYLADSRFNDEFWKRELL